MPTDEASYNVDTVASDKVLESACSLISIRVFVK